VKCKPIGEEKVTPPAVKLCGSYWLDYEVDLVMPKLIIALGTHAASYIVGGEPETGKILQSKYGIPCIHTPHTAYLMRLKNASKTSEYVRGIYEETRAKMNADWALIAKTIGVDVE
jgi:uracil-DNA glycosylase family 4